MCKYKNKAWPVIFYLTVFFIFSMSLYSKRQTSIVLSHVFYFLLCCFSVVGGLNPKFFASAKMRRVLADLEAIGALYPPVSQSLECIYKSLGFCFLNYSAQEDVPG